MKSLKLNLYIGDTTGSSVASERINVSIVSLNKLKVKIRLNCLGNAIFLYSCTMMDVIISVADFSMHCFPVSISPDAGHCPTRPSHPP